MYVYVWRSFTSSRQNIDHFMKRSLKVNSFQIEGGKPDQTNAQPQNEAVFNNLSSASNLILKYESIIEQQPLEQIIRLQSDGPITHLFCVETDFDTLNRRVKRKSICKNLGRFEDLLPPSFFRCHQSHMVNRAYVKLYDKSDNVLLLLNNDRIPVSRSGKTKIERWLNQSAL